MKIGIKKRILALVCVLVLAFCDVGSVLAENNITLPVAEENQDSVELPDQDVTEQPDDGTIETPDEGTTDDSVQIVLEKPYINSIYNRDAGIVFEWDIVKDAVSYKIFRSDVEDDTRLFEEIATVEASNTIYTDTTTQPGAYYAYKVQAVNGNVVSEESVEKCQRRLTTPTVKVESTPEGLLLTWNEVEGAEWYQMDKHGEGWEELPDTTEPIYLEKDPYYGHSYRYKIWALCTDEYTLNSYSSSQAVEISATYDLLLTPQSFKVVNNGYTQVKLTWDYVYGSHGYQIYRSKTNKTGSFVKVATVTDAKYIDKNLTPDTKYYYKIRAYAGDEVSEFTEVKSATPKVLTPKMNKTVNAAGNYVKVSWSKPAGVNGYYVYRKQGADGTWKQIATVKDPNTTSYKDTTATGRYYYAVRAYKKVDGKTYTSLRANSIQASVLKKASITVKQDGTNRAVTVEWGKINNATGYQVYKKVGKNGSWKLAKTTGADARTFTATIPQGTYTYWKVRAIRKINDVTTYALFSDSKSFIFANPKFTFEVSDNYGSSVKKIKLTIENTSSATLRFYTENAMLMDEYDDSYARDLYLTGSSGQRFTYSEVKAGKTKTFTYTVDGAATRYRADTVVGFMFRYDGLKYVLLTYADGSYFELYLEEDLFE